MSVVALALALAGGLAGPAAPGDSARMRGGFRDVRIERPFDAYLRGRPLLMQITGARFIRLQGGRRAVLAVASAVPAGEGPGALMEAEKACRLRALAALVAHRDGVRVTHLEKVEEKTVLVLENGKEKARSTSRALEARSGEPWQARVAGEAQPMLVVRSAAPRLDDTGLMPPGEQQKLALLLGLPEAYVKPAGLAMPATPGELRGLVLRAEGEGG
jgi:hypothetical protein